MTEMTDEAVNFCLKRKEWIKNPHTVDKLYLSNHGFVEISNLERFNGVKELFLGRNLISKIANLECLLQLSELHLPNNKIEQIENLSGCPDLKVLNLSENAISHLESIRPVVSIPHLRELDLSSNKLNGEYQALLDILAQCTHLEVLSLKGNPITKKMPDYRKMVVSKCSGLKSLDGREICTEERRRCNAWGAVIWSGGSTHEAEEADRRELVLIGTEKSEKNAKRRRDASH